MGIGTNLRFLLQKELKPSDVGTLGRIVLPKVRVNSSIVFLEKYGPSSMFFNVGIFNANSYIDYKQSLMKLCSPTNDI